MTSWTEYVLIHGYFKQLKGFQIVFLLNYHEKRSIPKTGLTNIEQKQNFVFVRFVRFLPGIDARDRQIMVIFVFSD